MKSWGRSLFYMFLWPTLTQPSKKVPLVYPLSTTVMGVDDAGPIGQGIPASVGSQFGVSELHQNLGGAIPYVYKCVGGCRWPRSNSGVSPASPASLSPYRVPGLIARNSHFGRNGGNLGKGWVDLGFWSSYVLT